MSSVFSDGALPDGLLRTTGLRARRTPTGDPRRAALAVPASRPPIVAVPDLPQQRFAAERGSGNGDGALRIALVGTRGVPAHYGGFETAVEEVGQRLVARGHSVTVYCRETSAPALTEHLGMRLVHLPAVRKKSLETLSHTTASTAHLLVHEHPDAVVLFNAANAPLLPLLKARGVRVATHMDGLEWKRAKWGGAGRRYYRMAERLAVRWSDALIADAEGIAAYYREEFDVGTTLIPYGAPLLQDPSDDRLAELGVEAGAFHVVIARFEPENHVDLALEGYSRSTARHPLLVVGSAPYADRYTARIRELAARDPRIRLLGAVWDQTLLDQLYAHALTYVHGHSVGGTNPSLLRAMGAATSCLAFDVVFNREVLGPEALLFPDADGLAELLESAEAGPTAARRRGLRLQERAGVLYRWDDVTDRYEDLCRSLAQGVAARGRATGRRAGVR